MGRIVVIDDDQQHATEVAGALRAVGCESIVKKSATDAVSILRSVEVDAVVIAADQDADWRHTVTTLLPISLEMARTVKIVCVLRGPYRGPADRLWGARRGVRVVYERY